MVTIAVTIAVSGESDPSPVHEGPVDLERVQREPLDPRQGRIPGAEVVEVDLRPEIAQLTEHAEGVLGIHQQSAFGDLEGERARKQPAGIGIAHSVEEFVRLGELARADVDRQGQWEAERPAAIRPRRSRRHEGRALRVGR